MRDLLESPDQVTARRCAGRSGSCARSRGFGARGRRVGVRASGAAIGLGDELADRVRDLGHSKLESHKAICECAQACVDGGTLIFCVAHDRRVSRARLRALGDDREPCGRCWLGHLSEPCSAFASALFAQSSGELN